MQIFNGCTMFKSGLSRAFFNSDKVEDTLHNNQDSSKEKTDSTLVNVKKVLKDKESIIAFNSIMKDKINILDNSFKNQLIAGARNKLEQDNLSKEDNDALKELLKILDPTNSADNQGNQTDNPEAEKRSQFELNGSLDGVQFPGSGKKVDKKVENQNNTGNTSETFSNGTGGQTTETSDQTDDKYTVEQLKKGRFFSKLSPLNNEGNLDFEGELGKAIKSVDDLNSTVSEFLKSENILNEETKIELNKIVKLLGNAKDVIYNPTPENVKILQKFIFDNLDEGDKKVFEKRNKFNPDTGEFDGKFGTSTLDGLNKILGKIDNYVNNLNDSKNSKNSGEKSKETAGAGTDILKNVKVKSEIPLPKDEDIKAEDLVYRSNLPKETSVKYEQGKPINMELAGPQEVKVKIKSGDKEEVITIIATVDKNGGKIKLENKPSTSTIETGKDTETKDQSKVEQELPGGYKLVQDITVMGGVALYDTNPKAQEGQKSIDGKDGKETIKVESVKTAVETLRKMNESPDEKIYLMKTRDGGVYAVKLDKNNCLYPIVVDVKKNEKVLLKNNTSCMEYLRNKLPEPLKSDGNISIEWSSKNRYAIFRKGKNRGLTIEPMTIAGKWVSSDLGQCLALLNFTNILRNYDGIENAEFKNDNPDLELEDSSDGFKLLVKVKKNKDLKKDSGSKRRYSVPLDKFGMAGISKDAMKKFIKYNNHEDWEDDWSKKEENQDFKNIRTLEPKDIMPAGGQTSNVPKSPNTSVTSNPEAKKPPTSEKQNASNTGVTSTPESQNPSNTGVTSTPESQNASNTGLTSNPENKNPSQGERKNGNNKTEVVGVNDVDNSETEISTDGKVNIDLKIGDSVFDAMEQVSRGKFFIEKEANGGFRCDMGKLKSYLETVKGDESKKWSNLRSDPIWICAVQIVLNQRGGVNLDIDGKFGPKTKDAVLKFQKKYEKAHPEFVGDDKIRVDGLPGPQTLNAMLNEYFPEKKAVDAVTNGKQGNVVDEIVKGNESGNVDIINQGLQAINVKEQANQLNLKMLNIEESEKGFLESLGIPSVGNVFTGENEKDTYYYHDNNKKERVKVSTEEPWLKNSAKIGRSFTSSVNVCKAGEEKLNGIIKSSNKLSNLGLSFKQGNDSYILNRGSIRIMLHPTDFFNEKFCGIKNVSMEDRIKIVCLVNDFKNESIDLNNNTQVMKSLIEKSSSYGIDPEYLNTSGFKDYFQYVVKLDSGKIG